MADESRAQEELQRLAYEAQMLQQQGQMISQRMGQLQESIMQLNMAMEALRSMKKGAVKSFIPIGGGALVPAKLEGGSVLIDLGASTAAEMKPDAAVELLEARLEKVGAMLSAAEKDAGKAAQRLQAIDTQARGLMRKLNITPEMREE
jgi:prefoldin alpha subunit